MCLDACLLVLHSWSTSDTEDLRFCDESRTKMKVHVRLHIAYSESFQKGWPYCIAIGEPVRQVRSISSIFLCVDEGV